MSHPTAAPPSCTSASSARPRTRRSSSACSPSAPASRALLDEYAPHGRRDRARLRAAQPAHRHGHGAGQRRRPACRARARASPVGLHTPSEVKAAITGYGSADKRQVGTMVARMLRLDAVPKPADAADALAIAICHAWRGGSASAAPTARRPRRRSRGATPTRARGRGIELPRIDRAPRVADDLLGARHGARSDSARPW